MTDAPPAPNPGRTVTLVVMDGAGLVLGSLPAFDVALPWWQEVAEIVEGARSRYGLRVDVLRLLTSERSAPHGGAVTYLVQTDDVSPGLVPVTPELERLALADEPLRAAYARPGGPAASLAWAATQLGEDHEAEQQRTWNLSAIWRLTTPSRTAWLKQVPTFFAHEAAVLAWAGEALPGAVPALLASGDDGRMLLDNVEGEDLYGASETRREPIIALSHSLQLLSVQVVDELAVAGVPDLRGQRLVTWIREGLADVTAGHPAAGLLDALDGTMGEVAACGLPDVLVHGDAHSGNAIGDDDRTVLIDWGDSFLGQPAFDALRIGIGLTADDEQLLLAAWARLWQTSVPGSDPMRAVELLRPVEQLRLAAVYAHFLASIEPSERVFHADDVRLGLDRAVAAAAAAAAGGARR